LWRDACGYGGLGGGVGDGGRSARSGQMKARSGGACCPGGVTRNLDGNKSGLRRQAVRQSLAGGYATGSRQGCDAASELIAVGGSCGLPGTGCLSYHEGAAQANDSA